MSGASRKLMGHAVAGSSGPAFELVDVTQLTSSSSNTSTWTASNNTSWQENDVVVCTLQGRIANSSSWNPASGTLESPHSSLSVTNVFNQKRNNNYGEFQQIFYGVATGSYSGNQGWVWRDNSSGQIANRRAHLWVMRGDGSAPSGYSVDGGTAPADTSFALTTGAATNDRIISLVCAPAGATSFTYDGDGSPSVEVPYYTRENHAGQMWFHDDAPAEIAVISPNHNAQYSFISISP